MALDDHGIYSARRHGPTHALPQEGLEPYTTGSGYIAWRRPTGQLALDLEAER